MSKTLKQNVLIGGVAVLSAIVLTPLLYTGPHDTSHTEPPKSEITRKAPEQTTPEPQKAITVEEDASTGLGGVVLPDGMYSKQAILQSIFNYRDLDVDANTVNLDEYITDDKSNAYGSTYVYKWGYRYVLVNNTYSNGTVTMSDPFTHQEVTLLGGE